jgi:hypothetical protein
MRLRRGPAGTITSKILREERILLKESTCFSVDVERHALFFRVWAKLLSENVCLRTGNRLALNLLRHKGCVTHDRQIESNSTVAVAIYAVGNTIKIRCVGCKGGVRWEGRCPK